MAISGHIGREQHLPVHNEKQTSFQSSELTGNRRKTGFHSRNRDPARKRVDFYCFHCRGTFKRMTLKSQKNAVQHTCSNGKGLTRTLDLKSKKCNVSHGDNPFIKSIRSDNKHASIDTNSDKQVQQSDVTNDGIQPSLASSI